MALTITNQLIIKEAKKYWIKYDIISEKYDIVLLEYNWEKKIIRRSRISDTSGVFSFIADNKDATYSLMEYFWYSYPKSLTCKNKNEISEIVNKLKYPLVIKPSAGGHWDWVTTNLTSIEDCENAYTFAKKQNAWDVIIQKHFNWEDYRIMVVNYKVIAVTKRIPARVFWDWKLSIEELINKENKNPLRWDWHSEALTKINIDNDVVQVLENQNKNLSYIPKNNEEVRVRRIWNLSQWWEAEDVTEDIPLDNIKLFEGIAKDLQAKVIWIDILTQNPTKILKKNDYCVIEVNVSPWIRMHHLPSKWKSHNVAFAILKTMFPKIK